jgi:hypothetical protein
MNPRLVLLILVSLCVGVMGSLSAEKSKQKRTKMNKEKIVEVDRVSVSYIKRNPPQLQIGADGKTGSSGWSEPELVQRVYIVPPADGIYDYDFVAKPPPEASTQILTQISATAIRRDIPNGMKGVRVHAKTNKKEAKL